MQNQSFRREKKKRIYTPDAELICILKWKKYKKRKTILLTSLYLSPFECSQLLPHSLQIPIYADPLYHFFPS